MGNLGLSIYPEKSTFEHDKEYLDLARKHGFTRIFTSLLEIDGDAEEVINKFNKIIEYGNSIGMETIVDINPGLFKQLNISYDQLSFFKNLGAAGIRLDIGFTGFEESLMTKNPFHLKIEVNMSSGTKYIENIVSYHPNMENFRASHNFYPQKYSGISQSHFEETTAQFTKYNIHTAAFVTSMEGKFGPWPVQTGLCTLEQHRGLNVQTQVTHYRLMGTIDDLLIGNAYATEAELKAMSEAFFSAHPNFEIELINSLSDVERKIILDEIHLYRGDRSEYMIRSTSTRIKYKDESIPAHHTEPIKKGDILICNDHFGQYKGETQVALKDMENEGNRNVIGHLKKDSIFLVDYLKPWSTFTLSI
ncbi:MupG family TIM beta-alpha barrel fold protein [Neobacillus sp. OS1-2]|uniref:DUF871 domain-containing protein n=1 Tax=Neobacillus sp. OS1-2 TaxID=3070680 RepID=UPI0027E09395|nr:MupG family TIM beta-alpha barrel fold protein [Neobacillus sp. OS1-2]WML38237.1 MupG family TIM beta-alpha barrel fold protein [Neobacillus sp. OS1-2]